MSQDELAPYRAQSGSYPMLKSMLRNNIPLSREGYIACAHAWDGVPHPWREDHEMDLPPVFRRAIAGAEEGE